MHGRVATTSGRVCYANSWPHGCGAGLFSNFVLYSKTVNIILFDESEITSPLDAHDERAQHLVKILHKHEGDFFDAGIVNSSAGKARITRIADGKISFDFCADSDADTATSKPLYPLVMLIGFVRPIQLKRIFRDMTGLGVMQIHLFASDLGEKSYSDSGLLKNGAAERILRDGAMQAHSTHLPELFAHNSLDAALRALGEAHKIPRLFALDNIESTQSLTTALHDFSLIGEEIAVAAIGSERGWSNRERTVLRTGGAVLCSMGIRTLRTESAATVSASLILSALGVL
ncbi:MAG: 16S rRNA (uracil(1498)-N(3))-methyltransferase [Treponemataceae bacterium]|nr:MAG: 16S rRNA (uracil(1498)-N(3))-methyltransferase [Treponemataceae bacterium]